MAETKGHKIPKGRRERIKAQWVNSVGNNGRQAHRPKKGQKWGEPNKPMSSSIKDKLE